ncbi:hypothetical protein [Paenibacillus sp. ISL-20]|uniref:hypothetical protein n=1 Tax=Paenibacillus sp. ISL-20 TaxID=2819163 RepID=UPI001BE8CA6E|nr:hypothetical protein [Paenibacillus sp. ISL-20]MBT2760299.1 hypothetical protein [Paenibacillus sp. ISL-20]
MKVIKRRSFITTLLFVSIFIMMMLTACGSNTTNSKAVDAAVDIKGESKAETSRVEKIKVAYAQAGRPITYVDESGKATGYDV